jgi:MFS superfamily sulfate permease-like transporter
MDVITRILKLLAAVAIVVSLLVFASFVFAVLVAMATAISVVIWFKRRKSGTVPDTATWEQTQPSRSSQETNTAIMVIEGEAEDVTALRGDTLPSAASRY